MPTALLASVEPRSAGRISGEPLCQHSQRVQLDGGGCNWGSQGKSDVKKAKACDWIYERGEILAYLRFLNNYFCGYDLCQRLSLAYRSNQHHDLLLIAPSSYVASVLSFPGKHE
jgi:hypothetical protein